MLTVSGPVAREVTCGGARGAAFPPLAARRSCAGPARSSVSSPVSSTPSPSPDAAATKGRTSAPPAEGARTGRSAEVPERGLAAGLPSASMHSSAFTSLSPPLLLTRPPVADVSCGGCSGTWLSGSCSAPLGSLCSTPLPPSNPETAAGGRGSSSVAIGEAGLDGGGWSPSARSPAEAGLSTCSPGCRGCDTGPDNASTAPASDLGGLLGGTLPCVTDPLASTS